MASIIQPIVILNSAMPRIEIFNLFSTETLAASAGVFIPIASVTYLFILDRSQGEILKNSPLKLLRAFLSAWVSERPKLFEDIFEKISLEKDIDTKIIEFNKKREGKRTALAKAERESMRQIEDAVEKIEK